MPLRAFIFEFNCQSVPQSEYMSIQNCEESEDSSKTSCSSTSSVQSWTQILTEKRGFNTTITKVSDPPQDWLNNLKNKQSRSGLRKPSSHKLSELEIRLLYAHYQIWRYCLDNDCSVVLLDNQSYPTQSSSVTSKLILAAKSMDADMVYFGKYLDRVDQYQFERTILVSESCQVIRFPVYSTSGPYGSFAQYITPKAAGQLIREMYNFPGTPENLAHRLIKRKCLEAWVYHPSIVKLSCPKSETFTYECREPVPKQSCWTWGHIIWYCFSFFLFILVILVIFTLFTTDLKCRPNQRSSCGYHVHS